MSEFATKADLTLTVTELKSELRVAIRDLKVWTGWLAAASVTVLAALHFWH